MKRTGWTFQNGDISATPEFDGNPEEALGAMTSRALVMPGQTDSYFPAEDGTFRPIPSIWGHWAGSRMYSSDTLFIHESIKRLLRT
jgi:homoserine O-acetyltransferase